MKHRRRNRLRFGWALACMVFVFAMVVSVRPQPVVAGTATLASDSTKVVTQPQLNWASYGGQAITVGGQELLAVHGSQQAMPTASIAKLMTALSILQQHPFLVGQQGSVITLTDADVAMYQQDKAQNQSVVAVQSGEQITEYQALQAILMPSACNMADSAAIWAFGSMQNYLDFANQQATRLGMKDTHFAVDASGASTQTVSTPQDLLSLGQAVLKQPVIMNIVAQTKAVIPVAGVIYNYNSVLGQAGITGLKTGNNDSDKGAFLFSAQHNNMTFLGVTMGAASLNQALRDSVRLLESAQSQVVTVQVVRAGQQVGHYTTPWGTATAVASKTLSVTAWNGTTLANKVTLRPLRSGSKSTNVGAVATVYNAKTLSVPATLSTPLPRSSLWWRVTHFT